MNLNKVDGTNHGTVVQYMRDGVWYERIFEEKANMSEIKKDLKQMSDGRVLEVKDVDDYKKSQPGVKVVEQQTPPTGPVSHKLTQGGK